MFFFGTLMWIDDEHHSSPNNKNREVESYFRQIALLSATLRASFAADLHVFTNDAKRISTWFRTKKSAPIIIAIAPSITVPSRIGFYSAHYKLDALAAGLDLLRGAGDMFILLDTDVIAHHPFSAEQAEMISRADLVVYDISDQVFPAYGAATVIRDIERVAHNSFIDPKWFGGEFIAGSKRGLTRLIEHARAVLHRYFEHAATLHHAGDEMFLTASLNALMKEPGDLAIVTQNPYRLVSRHWSRSTERPIGFHLRHSFVHCPGSKPVLELLSLVKAPGSRLISICLRVYQMLVLVYQSAKAILKQPSIILFICSTC